MTLHERFNWHLPNLRTSHWDDDGDFVSTCTICGRVMVKPPGGRWKLREQAGTP